MSEERSEGHPGDERQVDEEAIARRAYQISESEEAGTPEENWARAERELRSEQGAEPGSETPAG